MMQSTIIKAMIMGFCGFAVFTLADAQVRYLGNAGFIDLQIMFMNTLVALIGLLIIAPFWGGLRSAFIHPQWKKFILHGLILTGQGATAVMAFSNPSMSLAKIYTLIFVAPFLAVLLGIVFFKDYVGLARWIAILCGFSGVLIALRPGVIPLHMDSFIALICGTLGAFVWVMQRAIGNKPRGQGKDSFVGLIFYPCFFTALFTAYPVSQNFMVPAAPHIYVIIIGGGLLVLLGLTLLVQAFSIAPAHCISPFHYVQLIFGVLWGYLFFSEMPDSWTLLGGLVIIASGLYIFYREYKVGKIERQKLWPQSL